MWAAGRWVGTVALDACVEALLFLFAVSVDMSSMHMDSCSQPTSAIAVFHPLLPAQSLNPAVPNVGPHIHPAMATVKVVTPSTTNGSMPEICAPHVSISWFAMIGAATPTVMTAVTMDAPRLMKRRFRLRSKKRFQVKISGADVADAVGLLAVDAYLMA